MDKQLQKLKWQQRLLLVLVLLSGFSLITLTVALMVHLKMERVENDKLNTLIELAGDIVYFDEVLTMSARMYAYTGKSSWLRRYEDHVSLLNTAFTEANDIQKALIYDVNIVSKANKELTQLEKQSFQLVKSKQHKEAASLLTGPYYNVLKYEYAAGMGHALSQARTRFEENELKTIDQHTRALMVCLGTVFVLFFLVIFMLLSYTSQSASMIDGLFKSLNLQLRKACESKEKLVLANRSKSVFLANMSHEIRTPLNGMLGNLQLLQDESLPEESSEIVSRCLRSSDLLSKIINDILDFSKIEEGKLDIEYKPFDVCELLGDVVSDLSVTSAKKGLNVSVDNRLQHNYRKGDQLRIKQILLNVLSNAVKFTSDGGITIRVYEDDQGIVCFVVEDTGIGMDEAALSRLFDRFEQADGTITRRYGGSGLGMSIVKGLIEMMSGSVEAKSSVGVGTVVTITLPLSKQENQSKSQDLKQKELPKIDGLNVLVAEDNEINQRLIDLMLTKRGVNLQIASNGQEALDLVTDDFDVILMDIQMPVMDGVEACLALRERQVTGPIIAVTANIMEEDVAKYLDSGFDEVLGKPINRRKLFDLLVRHGFKNNCHDQSNVALSG